MMVELNQFVVAPQAILSMSSILCVTDATATSTTTSLLVSVLLAPLAPPLAISTMASLK